MYLLAGYALSGYTGIYRQNLSYTVTVYEE
jgi:hypothetical protein